jgi:hypothetical protein
MLDGLLPRPLFREWYPICFSMTWGCSSFSPKAKLLKTVPQSPDYQLSNIPKTQGHMRDTFEKP